MKKNIFKEGFNILWVEIVVSDFENKNEEQKAKYVNSFKIEDSEKGKK